jgi:hypothetical protein
MSMHAWIALQTGVELVLEQDTRLPKLVVTKMNDSECGLKNSRFLYSSNFLLRYTEKQGFRMTLV